MVRHSAFSMIELIFAIVIIAISVLSLPMINQITSKNIEGSITQEAIFAASAELNQVISLAWDENSKEPGSFLSRVVWVNATDCNTITQLRPGHIEQPYHRRCADANATRPTTEADFGSESGDLDDLDDINQTQHSIFINSGSSASGYKKIYNSQFTVSYANFGTILATDRNIKRIDVNITNENNETITVLSTFSSNIGEVDYYKRNYP